MFLFRLLSAFLTILLLFGSPALAQQQVGVCHDQTRGQSFALYDNYYMHQVGMPMNGGYAAPDPSGLTFLRIPSANPFQLAFFVDWQGRVIEINPMGAGPIGFCQFASGFQPFGAPQYQVPELGSWGVRTGNGVQPLPQGAVNQDIRYTQPLYTSEQQALACYNSTSGQDAFADCMLDEMLGEKEQNVYECAQENGEVVDIALCSIRANGGANEQVIVANIMECRQSHGDDWSQYPICMMEQEMSEDQARLVGCLKDQAEGGEVTLTGTAVCYGGASLNPELQIAMECAVTTGGNPMAFAGCAGGQLTQRELTKCFTQGVGGNGCFGPNNEIVKALRAVGVDVTDMFGPTNDVVVAWNNAVNDLQNGPGENNEAVKAITTISNDLVNGPGRNNDIVQGIDKVFPGFANLF